MVAVQRTYLVDHHHREEVAEKRVTEARRPDAPLVDAAPRENSDAEHDGNRDAAALHDVLGVDIVFGGFGVELRKPRLDPLEDAARSGRHGALAGVREGVASVGCDRCQL